jgi:hypothetical protein
VYESLAADCAESSFSESALKAVRLEVPVLTRCDSDCGLLIGDCGLWTVNWCSLTTDDRIDPPVVHPFRPLVIAHYGIGRPVIPKRPGLLNREAVDDRHQAADCRRRGRGALSFQYRHIRDAAATMMPWSPGSRASVAPMLTAAFEIRYPYHPPERSPAIEPMLLDRWRAQALARFPNSAHVTRNGLAIDIELRRYPRSTGK